MNQSDYDQLHSELEEIGRELESIARKYPELFVRLPPHKSAKALLHYLNQAEAAMSKLRSELLRKSSSKPHRKKSTDETPGLF